MLTFKSFIKNAVNLTKQALPIVHMNAGVPPNSKLIDSEDKDKLPAVYMNAGGPPEKQNITESVKSNKTLKLKSTHHVLMDPVADNTGVDDIDNNDYRKFIKQPKTLDMRTYPYLTNQQSEHYKALTKNTQSTQRDYLPIVRNYTKTSHDLNSHLFKSHIFGIEPDPVVQNINIQKMDNLIAKHKTPNDMVVYTGPHFNPEHHAGQEVYAPSYTSTSLTPHVAKEFGTEGNHILRIHLPKGHSHLFMDHHSRYQGQSEVVLPRGIRLRIADKPSHSVSGIFNDHFTDHNYRGKETYHFWDAHIVPGDK